METEQQKIGMIDQFIFAVAKPKEYKKLMSLKVFKVVLYTLLLTFLLTVMSYGIPTAGWLLSYQGVEGFFKNQIPAFTFADGKLNMESEIVIEQEGVNRIIVDTSKEKVGESDLKKDYMQQIVVSKTNMLVSSMNTVSEVDFGQLGNIRFDKSSLSEVVPLVYISLLLVFGIQFVFMLCEYSMSAFFYGLIAMLYMSMGGKELPLGDAVKAAIYAKPLAAVVGAVNTVMGSFIPSSMWGFLSLFATMMLLFMGVRQEDELGKEQN